MIIQQEYDYSKDGYYFVTICTHKKRRILGNIRDGKIYLSRCGKIVYACWSKIPEHFPGVILDEFVVMPNHVHGIIKIPKRRRGTACRAPTTEHFRKPVPGSIPTIIRSFKSAATNQMNKFYQNRTSHLWQRNYYEHIIRNEYDLYFTREYILNNPKNWDKDSNNPLKSP